MNQKTIRSSLALLAVAVLCPCGLRAEDPPSGDSPPRRELPPHTVFASRADRPEVMDTGFALDAREIRDRDRPGLWEVLQDFPGVHVANPGALGANYELSLRGGDPNFTKVLVDGIEVNNLTDSRGGSHNLNALSPLATERIELLPGARSAIYGSEALSGVLLLDTLPPRPAAPAPPAAVIEGETGGGEYRRLGGSVSGFPGPQDKFFGRLTFENESEDGVYEQTRFDVNRATAGVSRPLAGDGLIRFNAFGAEIERDFFPDDSGGPGFAVLRETEHRRTREAGTSLRANIGLNDSLDLFARAFYYRAEEEVDSPGVAPGLRDPFGIPSNSEETEFDRWGIDSHLEHRPFEALSLTFGASLKDESGNSESVVLSPSGPLPGDFAKSIRTGSLYAEGVWRVVPGQHLSLALRYDDIEGLDNQTSERASYTVDLPFIDGGARLAYGSGYKNPSFFALASPVVGNPDLRDEESDLYEITLSTRPANGPLRLGATAFLQEFTDLIDFSPGPPPQLVNRDGLTSRGFTGELSWQAGAGLGLTGNVTYVDLDLPSGSPPI
ncbi:MAG: TonB-dependent receptor plug domain-containing protein, partial [Puniceicoccaceae bacterium]